MKVQSKWYQNWENDIALKGYPIKYHDKTVKWDGKIRGCNEMVHHGARIPENRYECSHVVIYRKMQWNLYW